MGAPVFQFRELVTIQPFVAQDERAIAWNETEMVV
jgi:hypothetical protein